ncbi:MAG: TIGR04283 family arsenosugar biosynthesis glycosyltransferase [Owenweeksia sp.]
MQQISKISIIIPTYQEGSNIGDLVSYLVRHSKGHESEVLVIDGGSTDGTFKNAEEAGAKVVLSPRKGRASQLNHGAEVASGDILYFLHADAFPPSSFLDDIKGALKLGYDFGNFRQKIQSENKWVKINSYASRFNRIISSGGDQSLFIRRSLFEKLDGYREDYLMMEDYEFFKRARKKGESIKIPKSLKVLDRKYQYNSFLRVNLSNIAIFGMYTLGVHPNRLYPLYKRWIKGPRYSELK